MTHAENHLKYEGHSDVEPPELRRLDAPPLRVLLLRIAIGVGIALVIVLSFSLYFYISDLR